MNLDEKEKKSILKVYDSMLDLCKGTTSQFYFALQNSPNILNNYFRFEREHRQLDNSIIDRALGNNSFKKTFGMNYIMSPDFTVKTELYNPIYESDIPKLSSISQSAYLVKTLECYFELDSNDIIDRILAPDNYGGHMEPRDKFVKLLIAINHKKITEEDIYNIIGYLDKGLLKIALRVSKVMIAPGVYVLVEEFVPVFTTALQEIMLKLLNDFLHKNSRRPSSDEFEALNSEAIRLACDIQLGNGKVIKNPHTFDVLSGFEDTYTKEKSRFDYIFSNPKRIVVTDWVEYKTRVKRIYGKTWKDDYTNLSNNTRQNIWYVSEGNWFDNRKDYSLQEQSKKYHK